MITLDKLQIYRRFNGDIDGYARMSPNAKEITFEEWRIIDEILQKLTIIHSGLSTSEFESQTRAQINEIAEDKRVCEALIKLISNS